MFRTELFFNFFFIKKIQFRLTKIRNIKTNRRKFSKRRERDCLKDGILELKDGINFFLQQITLFL
jgi:hypothetical protein